MDLLVYGKNQKQNKDFGAQLKTEAKLNLVSSFLAEFRANINWFWFSLIFGRIRRQWVRNFEIPPKMLITACFEKQIERFVLFRVFRKSWEWMRKEIAPVVTVFKRHQRTDNWCCFEFQRKEQERSISHNLLKTIKNVEV